MSQDLNDEDYFDKQKKIHRNKFLYDFALSKLNSCDECKYTQESFRSWYFLNGNKKMLYDGKEDFLVLQSKVDNIWQTNLVVGEEDLDYFKFIEIINLLKK